MKSGPLLFLFVLALTTCLSLSGNENDFLENVIFLQKDKEILGEIFEKINSAEDEEIGNLMLKVGAFFAETPYVAQTLEIEPNNERLVINLREMDCNTFAENCLAISRTIKGGNLTFEKFARELQKIRYREGRINGYPSRLHYFSDWIYDNDIKNVAKSVSQEIVNIPYEKTINFMSTHPESYIQLKDSAVVLKIAQIEREISGRKIFYIPKENLSQVESKLKDGDIVGITTGIKGLDMVHVGILLWKSGRIHLMHASSVAKKVLVSENTLEDYLINSKTATGIMVSRPE